MGYPFSSPNGYEEELNQQFAGYLHYSLQIDPHLLNAIHQNQPITFSDEARLVAHQNSPLPRYTETGPDREIDWVIGDEDKLVGYESKYGDSLRERQLRDELEKLRVNAEGRDIRLIAVTHHTTLPRVLDQFEEEPVYWLSWLTVSRRLRQIEGTDLPPEQRPILRMLQDLFEAEDMYPFTGFDHHDKQQYRYFIRDLRQELVGTGMENRSEVHTWTTKDPDPSTWKRIVPKYLDVPFVQESRDEDSGTQRASYLTVVVDIESHDVHVGIVFNVREVAAHRDYVTDRIDDLVEYGAERELQLWTSMNSLNEWKYGVAKTDDPAEMRHWLEDGSPNSVAVEGTKYKKAWFVRECSASDPSGYVREVKEELLNLYERFLVADDLYPWPTLEDHS